MILHLFARLPDDAHSDVLCRILGMEDGIQFGRVEQHAVILELDQQAFVRLGHADIDRSILLALEAVYDYIAGKFFDAFSEMLMTSSMLWTDRFSLLSSSTPKPS